LPPTLLHMQLVGANAGAQGTALDEQVAKTNYEIGSDPGQWHLGVANYGDVQYQGVYKGVNVVYYGNNQQQLEYDFTVAPGADAGQIQLQFTGQQGMAVDAKGDLVLHTAAGDVVEQAPVAYQMIDGVRQAVSVHYVLEGNGQVGFALGSYDPSQALVIDPVLSYSVLLGGAISNPGGYAGDTSSGIAVDSSGNVYITGTAGTPTFPGTNQTISSFSTFIFVSKLDSSGNLLWTTLIGDSSGAGSFAESSGVAVDSSGDIYITGVTGTAANAGGSVSKLNSSGVLLWSSLTVGGEDPSAIAVDSSDNIYITGDSISTNFQDYPFVSQLSSSGALQWSTSLPIANGTGESVGYGIVVDSSDNVYVTGDTTASTFPGTSQTNAGGEDAFVSKLNASGAVQWSTFVGGSGDETGFGIALGPSGYVYIVGSTTSTTLPGAVGQTNASGADAFVSSLTPAGSLYWTYLLGGTSNGPSGTAIAVKSSDIYVTGGTSSPTFPGTSQTNAGGEDAFVSHFNTGGALLDSYLLGGSGDETGTGIAADSSGDIYITGNTTSSIFPGTNQTNPNSSLGNPEGDIAFVSKLAYQSTPTVTVSLSGTGVTSTAPGGFSLTYGTSYSVNASVTGIGGVSLGTPTLTYYDGANTSGNGSSTAPTNAGTYTVVASYAGSGNYTSASASATFTIQQGVSTVSVTDAGGPYNGSAYPATASLTLVSGDATTVTNVGLTLDYQQLDSQGNVINDLGTTAPTAAGSYKVTASFAGSTNFPSASASTTFTVSQVTPTLTVSDAGGPYIGSAYPATASVTGVSGNAAGSLEGVGLTLDYQQLDSQGNVIQDLGATAPTAAGSYQVTASFAGSTDYTSASASTTFTISQVTPTLTVSDAGGIYNGNPSPAVGTALGVDSKTPVAGSFSYGYYAGNSATGTASATAPSNAGTYTVLATFTSSDPNYTGGTAQITFAIAKATTALRNLTASQIVIGTATTTVSGQLTSNTILPVGQSISITLDGVTQRATVRTDGTFAVNFATGALAVGQYTISYGYAGDANFDAASGTGSLTVAYGTQLLFDNSKAVHAGSCLPVKLEVTNATGTDISSSNIAVTATSLVGPGGVVALKPEGNANPNNLFRYDASLGGYIFNLDTKGQTSGTYTLYYTIGNDPTLHSLTFVVS